MAGQLSVQTVNGVSTLTLERPEKRNALSIDLRVELAEALESASTDENVGCLVLTGAGSAFSSGMDVTQFGGDRSNRERLVETSTRVMRALAICPKPVVAAVNGPALAGGFVLALLCDIRLAGEEARFGFPELPRGIPPSYAAARAVVGPALARELCLTGRILDATEAQQLGIVSNVLATDRLLPAAIELAERIAQTPRFAISETKRRALLDAQDSWLRLFEDEQRVFREAVLGDGRGEK